jgi:hypothetical protein
VRNASPQPVTKGFNVVYKRYLPFCRLCTGLIRPWMIACIYLLLISLGEQVIGRVSEANQAVAGITRYEGSSQRRVFWVVGTLIFSTAMLMLSPAYRLIANLLKERRNNLQLFFLGCYILSGYVTLAVNDVAIRDWLFWTAASYGLMLLYITAPQGKHEIDKFLNILAPPWVALILIGTLTQPNLFQMPGQMRLRLAGAMGSASGLGITASIVFFVCLAITNKGLRICFSGLCFSIILLTGSRTALFSFLGALGVYIWAMAGHKRRRMPVLIIILAILSLTVIGYPFVREPILELEDRLLALDNPYRGTNSGFTGRTSAWADARNFWLIRPVCGWGPSANTQLLYPTSAHSAFWAKMVDFGIAGTTFAAAIVILAFYNHWKSPTTNTSIIIVSILVCAFLQMITEDVLFCSGLSSSVLTTIVLFIFPTTPDRAVFLPHQQQRYKVE